MYIYIYSSAYLGTVFIPRERTHVKKKLQLQPVLLYRDSCALVRPRLKQNRVIKFVSLLLLLPAPLLGFAPYLHNGRWNRVISNMRKEKFALYEQRSPIHQSRISQITLKKHA
jgi:hypothetical protein